MEDTASDLSGHTQPSSDPAASTTSPLVAAAAGYLPAKVTRKGSFHGSQNTSTHITEVGRGTQTRTSQDQDENDRGRVGSALAVVTRSEAKATATVALHHRHPRAIRTPSSSSDHPTSIAHQAVNTTATTAVAAAAATTTRITRSGKSREESAKSSFTTVTGNTASTIASTSSLARMRKNGDDSDVGINMVKPRGRKGIITQGATSYKNPEELSAPRQPPGRSAGSKLREVTTYDTTTDDRLSRSLSSRTFSKNLSRIEPRPKRPVAVEGVALSVPRPGQRPASPNPNPTIPLHRQPGSAPPPESKPKPFHWGSKKPTNPHDRNRHHRDRDRARNGTHARPSRPAVDATKDVSASASVSVSATPQPKVQKYKNFKFSKTKVKEEVEPEVDLGVDAGVGAGVGVDEIEEGEVREGGEANDEEALQIPGLTSATPIRTDSPLTPLPESRLPTPIVPIPVPVPPAPAHAPGSADDLRDIYGEDIEEVAGIVFAPEALEAAPRKVTRKGTRKTKESVKGRGKKKELVKLEAVKEEAAMLSEVVPNVDAGPSQTKKRKKKGDTIEAVVKMEPEEEGEMPQLAEKPTKRRKVTAAEGEDEKVKKGRKKVVETKPADKEKGKEKATPRTRKRKSDVAGNEEANDELPKRGKRAKLEVGEPDLAYGHDWGGRWSRKNVKSTVKWKVVDGGVGGSSKAGSGGDQVKPALTRKAGRSTKVKEAIPKLVVDVDEGDGDTPKKTLRPSIWTGSKSELLLVLSELSGSKYFNGVTEGSSNFPMVMLDGSTAGGVGVQVAWGGQGEGSMNEDFALVKLTLTRDFVCPARELVGEENVPINFDATSNISIPPNLPLAPVAGPSAVSGPQEDEEMSLEYIDEVPPIFHKAEPLTSATLSLPVDNGWMTVRSDHELQTKDVLQGTSPSASPTSSTLPTFYGFQPLPMHELDRNVHDNPPMVPEEPEVPYPEFESMLDAALPRSLPHEIEILSSASRLSSPLILIASREVFNQHFWAPASSPTQSMSERIGLAEEHAYVFLGFFRILRKDERKVALAGDKLHLRLGQGNIAGCVEWTFEVVWVPGYGRASRNEHLDRPWWSSSLVFSQPQEGERVVTTTKEEGRGPRDGFAWLQTQARLNLLPMQLMNGQEEGSSDEAMPRGWLCKNCGRLNQKVMMRHRWCGSTSCRDEPLSRGYAVELDSTREPYQIPLALPINTCNQRILDVRVADWDDGMKTLKYRPALADGGAETGMLKHVFTCNLADLQREATPLFEKIQREVCLTKRIGDSGPMYRCQISDFYRSKKDKYAFSHLSWGEAPQVVRNAQELMVFMGRNYGEDDSLTVDHLTIVGWVSSGSRKTPETLAAKGRTIAMLCLGNDVVLTIVPKWEIATTPVPPIPVPHLSRVQASTRTFSSAFWPQTAETASAPDPMVLVQPPEGITMTAGMVPGGLPNEGKVGSSDVDAVATAVDHVWHQRSISDAAGPDAPAGKSTSKSKQVSEYTMSVTLVHGDMLLFSGCDFEYSIKRMGTSILLVGTKA